MKNLFKILLLISIAAIPILFTIHIILRLSRASTFHFPPLDALALIGMSILAFGCFMFHVRHMKQRNARKYSNVYETSLDDYLVSKKPKLYRPHLLLQVCNILFGAGAGMAFVIMREWHFLTAGLAANIVFGGLIWACLYAFIYIIPGGVLTYALKNR